MSYSAKYDQTEPRPCKTCLTVKNAEDFAIATVNGVAWRRGTCKKCRSAGEVSGHLMRKYGLSVADRDQMLADQGGVCLICGSDDPKHRYGWATDHCHKTGEIRGILCQPDNLALGAIQAMHDAGTLAAAMKFLGINMVYSG